MLSGKTQVVLFSFALLNHRRWTCNQINQAAALVDAQLSQYTLPCEIWVARLLARLVIFQCKALLQSGMPDDNLMLFTESFESKIYYRRQ